MLDALRARLLPESQRRTLEELTADLELRSGDSGPKRSAFWTMLTLSAVIACAGVLADSTATVIGAMIIAPLSTPIMGIALAIAKRTRNGSVPYVAAGALLVVVIGMAFAAVLPGTYDLLENSQITGRTSPGVLDLVAAVATGLAGAVALARRDVAAVLPGVAIAISLVPPLGVVGVCLGRGEPALAAGALLLFLSNLLALVLAGTFVFTVLGYADPPVEAGGSSRRTYVTLGLLVPFVVVPLVANTYGSYLLDSWTARVETEATAWLQGTSATVTGVDFQAPTFVVHVLSPDPLPPTDALLAGLRGQVPGSFEVEVESMVGSELKLGKIDG